MEHIMELSHVTKDYGNQKGIFDVNFTVEVGEVFGYLGPNGAGKTTTIRQLLGFQHPDAGECSILEKDCFTQAKEIQCDLGYLAGELSFIEDMTGEKYLEFMAQMKRMKNRKRMYELSDMFELDARGKMRKMSKGMKQKIGIICAFMAEPKVVVLDEPTSGLDPLMQNRFVELILEEKKKGTTILMSSHIFEEIEKTCDRTAIIRAGKIVTVEDMNSLSEKRKKIYTVTCRDEASARRLAEDTALAVKEINKNRVELIVSGTPAATLQRLAAADPLDLSIKTQSLEELFMHYYGEEER